MQRTPKQLLVHLNTTYTKLHTAYEKLFWHSKMGDHSVNQQLDAANHKLTVFRTSAALRMSVQHSLKKASGPLKQRLEIWECFFALYQTPEDVASIKKRITELETRVEKRRASRKEGYRDPRTKKWVNASENEMRSMLITESDERMRKAVFDSLEELATSSLVELLELVDLRNQFARALGYKDFYDYKVTVEEGMSKDELFKIFDEVYEKTSYAFNEIREREKERPGLRKPWNKAYMLSGSFVAQDDPYFPFDQALERWGRSFARLGVTFAGSMLQLDLLDRRGKYNNGFCHWPQPVHYSNGIRQPSHANFTCTTVLGHVGEGEDGMHTLFHEGGHAAHLANCDQREVILNTEWPPMSTAWAETQSMFMDTVFSSIEWRSRYARDSDGNPYPFSLYEEKVRELQPLRPLSLMGMMAVMNFERQLYESASLTPDKIQRIARAVWQKHSDTSAPSLRLLSVPHIYNWESACSYHGYALATLALYQWREHFFKTYGYIVDNPKVGKDMKRVWKYGASRTFSQLVRIATGKKLSAKAWLKQATRSPAATIQQARKNIARLDQVSRTNTEIRLGATIHMLHGKEKIADSEKGFEAMAKTYAVWLSKQSK